MHIIIPHFLDLRSVGLDPCANSLHIIITDPALIAIHHWLFLNSHEEAVLWREIECEYEREEIWLWCGPCLDILDSLDKAHAIKAAQEAQSKCWVNIG